MRPDINIIYTTLQNVVPFVLVNILVSYYIDGSNIYICSDEDSNKTWIEYFNRIGIGVGVKISDIVIQTPWIDLRTLFGFKKQYFTTGFDNRYIKWMNYVVYNQHGSSEILAFNKLLKCVTNGCEFRKRFHIPDAIDFSDVGIKFTNSNPERNSHGDNYNISACTNQCYWAQYCKCDDDDKEEIFRRLRNAKLKVLDKIKVEERQCGSMKFDIGFVIYFSKTYVVVKNIQVKRPEYVGSIKITLKSDR